MTSSPTMTGSGTETGSRPADATPRRAMTPARTPTGAGRIGLAGPLMAVALTAAGVVLVHDAIAEADSTPGRTWLAFLIDTLDRTTAAWWMIPAGAGVALIGMWLIVNALRPRSRKSLAVTSATGVHLRTRDVARLASAAADDVDGVLSATSVAGRRVVTVTVESERDGIADLVHGAVAGRLSALADPPKTKIRVRSRRLRDGA
jgi:hypothetical protein